MDWRGSHSDVWAQRQCHETCDHEERQQANFGDGENVAELVAAGDAAIIHGGKETDDNDENRGSGKWFCRAGEELSQIDDEEISHGGSGGDASQPGQPAILNGKKAAERHTRVKIGSARVLEL